MGGASREENESDLRSAYYYASGTALRLENISARTTRCTVTQVMPMPTDSRCRRYYSLRTISAIRRPPQSCSAITCTLLLYAIDANCATRCRRPITAPRQQCECAMHTINVALTWTCRFAGAVTQSSLFFLSSVSTDRNLSALRWY